MIHQLKIHKDMTIGIPLLFRIQIDQQGHEMSIGKG